MSIAILPSSFVARRASPEMPLGTQAGALGSGAGAGAAARAAPPPPPPAARPPVESAPPRPRPPRPPPRAAAGHPTAVGIRLGRTQTLVLSRNHISDVSGMPACELLG